MNDIILIVPWLIPIATFAVVLWMWKKGYIKS